MKIYNCAVVEFGDRGGLRRSFWMVGLERIIRDRGGLGKKKN